MSKIRFVLGIIAAIGISVGVIFFNTGEYGKVQNMANNFMDLIYRGNYSKAYQYVDSSRIKFEELKDITNLASHYSDARFYEKTSESLYKVGFKPDTLDKNKKNDEALEFWIAKVNGEWKVINIYSILGKPLYK